VLKAFRQKARDEYTHGRSVTDPREFEERVKLAQEVAAVIRHNIVQAEKVPEKEDTWAIRMTQDIELGDNESIKSAKQVGTRGPAGISRCCSNESVTAP